VPSAFCGPLGGVQLASVARLLCGATIAEGQKLRVETVEDDVAGLSAGVEVARMFLARNEATVEIGGSAPGVLQRSQCIQEPVEKLSRSNTVA
jgi:hypothetical protein